LAAGTQYVFNIWAYDLASNTASSTIELVATTTSSFTPPTGSINTTAQKTNGTGGIDIAIAADDADNDNTLRAKLEYEAGSSCAFISPIKATIDSIDANTTATYGDPKVDNNSAYQVGSSTGWILTAPGSNFVFFDWLSKADLPGINATYCLRLTVNDGLFDQTTTSTKLILLDNLDPAIPGALTLVQKNNSSMRLAFGAESSDTNFDRYRIFYATSSPVTQNSVEHTDTNLNNVYYSNATSTFISGLLPDTQYYINIWAYDDYGNSTSTAQLAVKTNAFPNNLNIIGQFRPDETTIVTNGAWLTQSEIRLSGRANDPDTSEQPTIYFEFIPNAGTFRTATTAPTGACVWGTAYGSCSSKVWYVSTSSPGDYSVTPFFATSSITAIPESSTGYKWQAIACDDDGDCSGWSVYDATQPNVKIDTIPPTAPGALGFSSKTSTQVSLSFGATTTEANFSTYRIFYSTSTPVTASSSEHTDANLGDKYFNSATLTTVENLEPNTQYYFRIFAYDLAGASASSTETAVTTNAVQSTPGVTFYTKNTRALFYRVWDGSAWGAEQTGPTLGSGATDNIRHIDTIRSDDSGKVAVLVKTWDGTNQEWWATVYRVAANNFATSTQLGATLANATSNGRISGCLASLSGGEFFIVRNNQNANGTLIYSWDASAGWTAQGAGPNPAAVLNGCRLVRRPGSDNYLLTTFDNSLDLGSSYYTGGATYSNSWETWSEHSINENNVNNFVGDAFFDPSDNTRGALNYSNSATNAYTNAKYFIADNSSVAYGSASSSPQSAPDNWAGPYVHGEFAADPGSSGIAYFAGRDTSAELNVYRVDISGGSPAWSTATNGDNISNGLLSADTNYIQKPFDIEFYKYYGGLVVWNQAAAATPKYRKINATANSIDTASSSVAGAPSDIWSRVKLYKDPNEVELLALYQNDNIDYGAVFWNGASNQFYSSGSQAWTTLASATGAFSDNDEATSFCYTGRNSSPNTPTGLGQFKGDGISAIANGGWASTSQVYLEASATDPDTSETIALYAQLIGSGDTFATSTAQPSSACTWGTAYEACASKIWFVASSSPGDYSVFPFTDQVSITGVPDSAAGYKWQVIACDDSAACSNWVKFNVTQPNFKVDTTPPSAPGNLSVASRNSSSVTLNFGATTTETNFLEYRIYYRIGASGVTEADLMHSDGDLGNINFNFTTNTTVSSLASSTQYVFRIWAYDEAGNKATSSSEVATTTLAAPNLRQTSFLLENDDGTDVNSNSADVAASTSLSNINKGERMNVRLQIENNGGDVISGKVYKLQFNNQTDAPGTWTDVTVSSEISFGLGLSGDNGAAITSAKATANGNSWTPGTWHEGVGQTGSFNLTNGYYTEFVFAIRTHNALLGKTYRLRLYNSTDNVPLNNYLNYPLFSTVASETIRYAKGLYPALPSGTTDPTYYFDPEGYADILTDDNANRDELAAGAGDYAIVNFISKNSTNTQAITASWNGQSSVAPTASTVYLQVYRFGATNAWVTVASNATSSANSDFTIGGNINSLLSQYYDGSYWTYWRVYQATTGSTVRSDYFGVAFTAALPVVAQKHYRWRADNGSETTANWLEAEDVGSPTASSTLAKGQKIRLRLSAANTGGGTASQYRYQLQYATTTSNCSVDPGNWSTVPTDNSRAFRMATSTYYNDGDPTTAQFTDAEGYSFVAGRLVEDPSNRTASTSIAELGYTEAEYAIYATPSAGDGSTYCFRMTNNGTLLNSYDRFAELTLQGNPNNIPTFAVNPSDNGSATNTPTSFGNNVVFTATTNDADNDNYYLAICQTTGITGGNDGPPTCNGGSWCISALASSTAEATCSYATATSTETNNWYGYACDRRAGVGVAKCSTVSQGGWGDNNDSPFNINHRPTFTSITTSVDNRDPGGTFTISSVSSETDTAGGADTLYLYVCRTNSATFAGCTGGAGNTVCQTIATTTPNALCNFTDTAPTPAGATTTYGFVYDSHGLAASANSRSSTYTVNNVPPTIGLLLLNGGANITVNLKGEADRQVQTVSTSITDVNGCATGLVSAVSTIYMSNATSSYSCTADDNDCYQIGTGNCVKSDCTGDNDQIATYTCTAGLKHFAIPTDDSSLNPWEPYNWLSRLQVFDGANYTASTSAGVELMTAQALLVQEAVIDFGSNIYAGEDTGTTNQPTTVVNAGNSPIDTDLSGIDMTGVPSGTIPAGNLEWSLVSGFNWSTGTDLTNGAVTVDMNLKKATTTIGVTKIIYWGIGIPFGSDPSVYTGQNVFEPLLDDTNW